MDEAVVTEMLPADNIFVQIMKLLYCANLVISYPITIVPVFLTIQAYVFKQSEQTKQADLQESKTTFWLVNMTRSFVLILSVIVSVWVADSLDTVIAVAGAVLGMTNVLLFPALCHLKLIAKTRSERIADYLIIAFSIFMVFFGPATILME